MFFNKTINLNNSKIHFSKGGVEGLNFLKNSDLNQNSNLVTSNENNVIDINLIDPNQLSYVPNLEGPTRLKINTSHQWRITNYNLNKNYNIFSNDGEITIVDGTVTFTPRKLGNVSFSLADRILNLTSVDEVIKKPSITNSQTVVRTTSLVLNTSAFEAINVVDTHKNTDWEVFTDESLTESFTNSLNSAQLTSFTLTGLLPNKTFYIRVRHRGNVLTEPSEWSSVYQFRTSLISEITVRKPTITTPANNSNDIVLSARFNSDSFFVNNWTDSHESSSWELSTRSDFTTILYSSIESTVNKTSWQPGNLPVNTVCYLRVRHKSENFGWSEWSDVHTFRTQNQTINTPTITDLTNNATNVAISRTFTASTMVSTGGLTYKNTDWQLSLSSSFSTLARSSMAGTGSWSVTGLTANTVYYMRVRHRSTNDLVSSWSIVYKFTTRVNAVYAPTILSPVNNTELPSGESFVITFSSFSATNGQTKLNTEYQISDTNSFANIIRSGSTSHDNQLSITTSNFSAGSYIYIRIRDQSNLNIYSVWSSTLVVRKPEIIKPILTVVSVRSLNNVDMVRFRKETQGPGVLKTEYSLNSNFSTILKTDSYNLSDPIGITFEYRQERTFNRTYSRTFLIINNVSSDLTPTHTIEPADVENIEIQIQRLDTGSFRPVLTIFSFTPGSTLRLYYHNHSTTVRRDGELFTSILLEDKSSDPVGDYHTVTIDGPVINYPYRGTWPQGFYKPMYITAELYLNGTVKNTTSVLEVSP